jgi:hypothetical protein
MFEKSVCHIHLLAFCRLIVIGGLTLMTWKVPARVYTFPFYGAGWPNSAFELKTTRRKSEERQSQLSKNLASDQKRVLSAVT